MRRLRYFSCLVMLSGLVLLTCQSCTSMLVERYHRPNTQLLTRYPNLYNLQVNDKSRSPELVDLTIAFETRDDSDTVFRKYQSILQQDGWKQGTYAQHPAYSMLFEIINSSNHPSYSLIISATRTLDNVTTVRLDVHSQGPR